MVPRHGRAVQRNITIHSSRPLSISLVMTDSSGDKDNGSKVDKALRLYTTIVVDQ